MLSFLRLVAHIKGKLFSLAISVSMHKFGHDSRIESPIRIDGESHISIGNNVFIGSDSWLSAIGSKNKASEAMISIGNHTSISGHCTITAIRNVTIESHVLIARYVYISDHSHSYNNPSQPIKSQSTTTPKPVLIKHGSWIAQSAVICPGVTIGRNSVVAANSLVRTDVPDNCVVAGSPAKVIKNINP